MSSGGYRDSPVRSYVITGGRTRPTRNTIRPETLLVVAEGGGLLPVSASTEQRALLAMCRRLLSLAEAAAHLGMPVSVVSVIASDLVDTGFLALRSGGSEARAAIPRQAVTSPDSGLLREVLNGLRKLI